MFLKEMYNSIHNSQMYHLMNQNTIKNITFLDVSKIKFFAIMAKRSLQYHFLRHFYVCE